MTKRRKIRSGCISCGGPCNRPCTDNSGRPYLGCDAGCRFKTLAEVEAETRRPAMDKAAALADRLAAVGGDRYFTSDPDLLDEVIVHLRGGAR